MPGVLTHTGSTMKRLRVARLGLVVGCLLAAVVSTGAQGVPPHDGLVTSLLASGDAAHRAGLLAAATPDASLVDALIDAGTRERVSGESSRAGVAFEAAVILARRLGDSGPLAMALTASGSDARRRGDLATAERLLREGVSIAESAGLDEPRGRAVHQLGIALKLQGQFDEALACYRDALAVSERAGHRADQAAQLMSIGNVLKDRGDYAQALGYYARALPLVGDDRDTRSAIYFNTAVVHEFQGDDALALDFYRRALAEDTANGYVVERAIDLAAVGASLGRLGRFDEAFAAMDEALPLLERADARIDVVNLLKDRAEVLRRAGRLADGAAAYERARTLAREIDNLPGYADATLSLARLRGEQGRLDEAAALARDGLEAERRAGSPLGIAEAASVLGDVLRRLGRMGDAQQAFEEAIAATETQFGQVAGDEDARQRFFSNRHGAYHGLFELHADAGRLDEAWLAAERGRARVLVDVLQRGRVLPSTAMTDAERADERRLRERMASAPAVERAQAARDLQAFIAGIYAQHPTLRLARGDAAIATRADAEDAVNDPALALVSWMVTETRVVAFVTTRDAGAARTTMHRVGIGLVDLRRRIEGFRREVGARSLTAASTAHSLHDLLLRPLGERLAGRSRLVIAPDGPLWELPWAALQPVRGRYLVEDVATTLVPSVTAWRAIRGRPPTAVSGPSVVALAQGRAQGELPALPEARQQADDLRRLYARWQVSAFADDAVSEATWSQHVRGHRVVHVAAHGVVDSTSPMSSALLLGTSAGVGDGRLEARELLDVALDADLVVLAACDTARGRVSEGEGMIGLTWAALVAGARNVVVSQWKVDAASTTALLRAFHARIAAGWAGGPASAPAADAALRAAALRVLRQPGTRHPFYWAGFMLVGDGTLTPAATTAAP